jgi:hypothetical protein
LVIYSSVFPFLTPRWNRADDHTCCDCDDPSAFYCYVSMFFAGGAMVVTGISLLVAYSILGETVFDSIH